MFTLGVYFVTQVKVPIGLTNESTVTHNGI